MAIVRTGGGVRLPRLDGGAEASLEATEDEDEEEEGSRATPSHESDADGFSAEEENGGGGGDDEPEAEEEEEEFEEEEDEGDSGMGSDELDVAELGEPSTEMCQVGDQSMAVPLELYDLDGLGDVLSLHAWNDLLSDDERLRLAAFLPDMDQETFARTLVELLAGQNFHFGSPLADFLKRLKGGLCDPRVNLYRRGIRFVERRKHYYWLQSYHNSMVRRLREIKDCWKGREGYSLDERLRMLDTMKAKQQHQQQQQRKALDFTRRAGSETDSESRGSGEQVLARPKHDKSRQKKAGKLAKEKSKGLLRVGTPKGVDEDDMGGSGRDAVVALSELSRRGYDSGTHRGKLHRSIDGLYSESEDLGYERDSSRPRFPRPLPKPVKKELSTSCDVNLYANNYSDNHTASPYYYSRNLSANQGVTLAAAYDPPYFDTRRNARYLERDWVQGGKGVHINALMGDEMNLPAGNHTGNSDDWQKGQSAGDYRSRKDQAGYGLKVKSYKSIEKEVNDARVGSDPRSKISQAKVAGKSSRQLDRTGQKHWSNAVYGQSDETESDSSEKFEDGREAHYLERKPERHHSGYHRPAHGAKKSNKLAKVAKMNYPTADADLEPSQSKGFKGKVSETGYLRDVDVMMTGQISDVMKPLAASGERKRKGVANLDMRVYDNSDLHEVNEDANDSFRLAEYERLASRSGHAVQDSNGGYGGTERTSSSSKKAKGRVGATDQTEQVLEGANASAVEQTVPINTPALTVQEIVNRIRANPGDPRILETQEPLQDLVRGVLKVLSSRTAPLGAKGWKALVAYEKSNKSWFWVGPAPSVSSYDDPDEETSAEAWSIPHKMLVKLVDAFSNWLKSGQETLKQIGSLPPPPPPNPANLDLKERFKELKAQKSLNTISPSSDEARTYFQREEFLRYSIPDRAFCYTAADGEKSIVAPLRRGGGKPTAKARGHPMLLPDRPPHVTILCLVRDAASRLPARTGTRADVCTLLRDSQYLNHEEANKEAAINQVVSGALDRLHYERDPCVLYDNDKKLWTYLHRGREEEDFEDDGTSSTKKWKRPRRDVSDAAEPGAANDDIDDDGAGTPPSNNVKKQKTTLSGEAANDEGNHPTQNPASGGLEGDSDLNAVPSSKFFEEPCGDAYIDARPDDGGPNSVDAKPGSTADDNTALPGNTG
uniref:DEUBAD domain-containing protein n=1 Tax=Zea mays TaxID=4577 RepID=A0A804QST7_MAIZE